MAHKQQALREMALFAGAGGGILGGKLLGWECVCAVEWEPYARAVLAQRQNDGVFERFPIWDDVRTFDGKPWRGIVDVVSGGFPCQDISAVGNGAGIEGERSGLWKEMARVVCEVRPRFVFVENSPMLLTRGMGTVLRDLAEMGFDARWGVLGAGHIGAPHARERVWILAYAKSERAWMDERRIRRLYSEVCMEERRHSWPSDAGILRVADGVAHRTHRIKAAGNGQVPRVAAAAWRILTANAEVTGLPLAAGPVD